MSADETSLRDYAMKRRILFTLIFFIFFSVFLYWMANRMGVVSRPSFDPGTVSTETTRQTFYKWQDASGRWHMGDTVPDGVNAIAVDVDTAANILQGIKTPAAEDKEADPGILAPAQPLPGFPMTVNPADVPKLIEQAKAVDGLMQQRQQQLEQVR